MKLGQDTNYSENTEHGDYRYTEDRLSKSARKKKSVFRSLLIFLGYLGGLLLVILVAGMLTTWINDKLEKSAKDLAVSAGAELLPEDQEVTLTQAELNARIQEAQDEAVENIQQEKAAEIAALQAEKEQAAAEAREDVLGGIRAGLETGDQSMVEVLRPFYPDELVVVSSGKFHFVPINRELKMNEYDVANLNILESGEYQYRNGEDVISHKGIDVSKFQGKIDWKAVAEDGVEFAFMRVAYRGYGTGKMVEDTTFEDNMKGAVAAGIHAGAYIYSQAINEDEIREEAELVISKLEDLDVKCPVVFDVEKTLDSTGRMNQLSVEERTNLTLLFCQIVEQAGYKPIVYYNMEMGALMLDIETLEPYEKWFAYYNDDMYYPYAYGIWQYSDKGRVNGIKGNVDMDISFYAFWEE
ncbi:MAG: glycoside hydrolase family 25 protein [Lachnospiraceae bacterium]|nr:glycoside hydrolase family 25 protein [Lachnospiraceae bacterium]